MTADRRFGRTSCPPELIPLLGTMIDRILAEQAGVSPMTAGNWRRQRGIAPHRKHPTHKTVPTSERYPGLIERLGTVSDSKLGRDFGLTKQRICQIRHERGVACWCARKAAAQQSDKRNREE